MKNIFLFLAVFVCNSALTQVSDFKSSDFTIADNRAKLFKGAPLDNLPLLAHRLTFNLRTDVEKFRAIYSWVCTNVKGDVNQHQKVTRKRKKLRRRL
mgnify:CR=1 FL=1